MALDLTALGVELDRDRDVNSSASDLIDRLAAEVEASKNDPVALQAMVDRLRANSDALAAKVANTSGQPQTPPIPA